jgi:rhodanese-related sulfurtransferase
VFGFLRGSSQEDTAAAAALHAEGLVPLLNVREKHGWDSGHMEAVCHVSLGRLAAFIWLIEGHDGGIAAVVGASSETVTI